jgi:DNA-binding NarL/FixJ family response regulator/anti-sigma regulatory factor (Ser/Thr protein kinase)
LAERDIEKQLLGILREALSNARKHSGVNAAQLSLSWDNEIITAEVKDEGKGFVYLASERGKGIREKALAPGQSPGGRESGNDSLHFGLRIMAERAGEVGGELEIQSTPGKGTHILVHLPRRPHLRPQKSGAQPAGVRLLLADDHPLFLEGLQNMLSARGIQVVGAAHDGLEAIEMARSLRPDLIAMDIQMPRCDGLEATRRIKAELPDVKIVMLTVSASEEHIFDALKAGASGYLLKSLDGEAFLEMLYGLMRDEVVIAPELASRVLAEFSRRSAPAGQAQESASVEETADDLSTRQREVLRLVAKGLTYKDVGAALGLTERTVKYHMGEILARLQLRNRLEAVLYARRTGLARS